MTKQSAVLVVMFLAFAVSSGAQSTNCSSCGSGNPYPTITLSITYPPGTLPPQMAAVPVSSNPGAIDTIRQVLINAACPLPGLSFTTTNYCPYGGAVTTINGIAPQSPNDYWEILVNGAYAQCGLDTCSLAPGNTVAFCVANESCSSLLAKAKAGKVKAGSSHQALVHKASAKAAHQ